MSTTVDEIIELIVCGRTMPKTRVKYPCSICYKAVRNNQEVSNVIRVTYGFITSVMGPLIRNMKF